MTSITARQVGKTYGATRVLDGVDLEVADGEFLVLLGASGSGKSTILRLLSGLERVTTGTIEFDGRVVSSRELTVPANRRALGFVFQSYALWPHLTVAQNVEYPLRARRHRPRADIERLALESLELVHMRGYAHRRVDQLSGGQQQRIALARAIVGRPGLLLFDEPLSNLDAALRAELRSEIHRLHRELGFTAVYVTHDNTEATVLADRIAVVEHGTIAHSAPARELFSRPVSESSASLLGYDNRLAATVHAVSTSGRQDVLVDRGVRASVRVATPFEVGDRVALVGRARGIVVHPLGSGPIPEEATDRPHERRISELTVTVTELIEATTGYVARFRLSDSMLSGVLSQTDWGPDPREQLRRSDWRATASIDWSQIHAVGPHRG
ncbi:ABC transporter ATP-binding protein [Agromyces sp. MMS24-JH15]|uniref:ABC transporter ATP-binding protein n=1 Tax=Agromyces sp. MMS24-JH15 TaxID=3243765 RepID=UPI0037483A8D